MNLSHAIDAWMKQRTPDPREQQVECSIPMTPETIAAAHEAGDAEKNAVISTALSGREAMWLTLKLFPGSEGALRALFWASEEFGPATCEREFWQLLRERGK